MYKKIVNKFKKTFKINHENYSYFIGEERVVIKFPSGETKLVDAKAIKGHFDPKEFKKILDKGEDWRLTDREIKKYIEDKFNHG